MANNKMLIDASHTEETRVVVMRGNRVEEFDFESAHKKNLRGNIYIAKVMRVEPSLQAAFVDYGGNRHGFLAFSEIHPDYYQIPQADRQKLIEEQERHLASGDVSESFSETRNTDSLEERAERRRPSSAVRARQEVASISEKVESKDYSEDSLEEKHSDSFTNFSPQNVSSPSEELEKESNDERNFFSRRRNRRAPARLQHEEKQVQEEKFTEERKEEKEEELPENSIEHIGGDILEDFTPFSTPLHRKYKIQDVIKRRQILLVQVAKEERGNKGAALTTYLSLAGRYSVLMPNTPRGGGISRKITNSLDRIRLKSMVQELEVPEGMGVILRTAGANRTKADIKRDFEYLLRMWESVRELALSATAPALLYEEGSLIKRSIRDLYHKDMDEILVAGEEGYREAKEFMRMLMPSHAKYVKLYQESQHIFARGGAETQLDAMFSTHVPLKSGGYIVINPTEALVAIDVNSGRSTREHNVEDTAFRTNLEAAEEIPRQIRLRDLSGLIVVDFIDMEENRNNRTVERRIKEALRDDRARIQVGRISHFGLLEMSRQRMRTSMLEGSSMLCPHCAGAGIVRATASIALHVLRLLEDALLKEATYDVILSTRPEIALYILNQKRSHLHFLEERFGVNITIMIGEHLTGMNYYILERGEPATRARIPVHGSGGQVRIDSILPGETAPGEEELDEPTETLAEEDIPQPTLSSFPTASAQDELSLEPELPEALSEISEKAAEPKHYRQRRRGRSRERSPTFIEANAPQPSDAGLEALTRIGRNLPGMPKLSEATNLREESLETGAEEGSGDFVGEIGGEHLPPLAPSQERVKEGAQDLTQDLLSEDLPKEREAGKRKRKTASTHKPRTRRTSASTTSKRKPSPVSENDSPELQASEERAPPKIDVFSPEIAPQEPKTGASKADVASDEEEKPRKRSGWWQRKTSV